MTKHSHENDVAFIQALADDAVKTAGGQVLVVQGSKAIDPVTGAEVPLPADAEDVINNNMIGNRNSLQSNMFFTDEPMTKVIKTVFMEIIILALLSARLF